MYLNDPYFSFAYLAAAIIDWCKRAVAYWRHDYSHRLDECLTKLENITFDQYGIPDKSRQDVDTWLKQARDHVGAADTMIVSRFPDISQTDLDRNALYRPRYNAVMEKFSGYEQSIQP